MKFYLQNGRIDSVISALKSYTKPGKEYIVIVKEIKKHKKKRNERN
jgi:hypothetical protein